jgi:ferrous iron transport protein B
MSINSSSLPSLSSSNTKAKLVVALMGNPNTGKSTLFSALTGIHVETGHFPGVTVERTVGSLMVGQQQLELIDLPGTYSLAPRAADEAIATQVLLGQQPGTPPVDAVLCVVDAANLQRNLFLVSQIAETALPMVIAVNMSDVSAKKGISLDVAALEERIGVPVVACQATGRKVTKPVIDAILRARPMSPDRLARFSAEFVAIEWAWQTTLSQLQGKPVTEFEARRLLIDPQSVVRAQLQAKFGEPFTNELLKAQRALREVGVPFELEAAARYQWASDLLNGIETRPPFGTLSSSDYADRWLSRHPVGLLVFITLMLLVFQSIFSFAQPLMELVEAGPAWVGSQIEANMSAGPLRSLLVNGVLAGVGGVVVFVPQLLILFLLIGILEDCGYMARAAFLTDRLLYRLTGLSGRAFVPLMSSFACAIPGMMSTRVIESPKERLITTLILPLMSCSARLPVYLLMINLLIPNEYLGGWLSLRALVLAGMMSLGAVVAIPVAWILNRLLQATPATPFLMELPSYKWPSPFVVLRKAYEQVRAFLVDAGTLILAMSIVIWGLGYFPGDRSQEQKIEQAIATQASELNAGTDAAEKLQAELQAEQARLLEISFLGQAGRLIEPAVKPLGWDWKIGLSVIASFPAREVIIATLGTIYSLGGDVGEDDAGLQAQLQSATWGDGRPVFTLPTGLSVMVFFALCAQCASTLVVMARETGSWRWPFLAFVYMTALAYIGAFLVYRLALMLGG